MPDCTSTTTRTVSKKVRARTPELLIQTILTQLRLPFQRFIFYLFVCFSKLFAATTSAIMVRVSIEKKK